MPIANYTTSVTAEKSAGEIQGMLAGHGAKQILFGYDDDGNLESISFIVKTHHGQVPFHLPANIERVRQVLINMRAKKPEPWHSDYQQVMSRISSQAYRVAWRILKDWVRAQMAIIETEMVTLEQVFLPYMSLDGKRTLYQVMEDRGYLLPEGRE